MQGYTTIQNSEISLKNIVEKSIFIASATKIESLEDAINFVAKKKKQYYDATHNCYAYIFGDKAKFSDDGEPQGTAGLPIFECIKNNGLDHVCVVVTRYFGGVKLGAGGLVRAYSGATNDLLKSCEKALMVICKRAKVVCDYSLYSSLRRVLTGKAKIENVVFENNIELTLLYKSEMSSTIRDIVSQNSLGKASFREFDELLYNEKDIF